MNDKKEYDKEKISNVNILRQKKNLVYSGTRTKQVAEATWAKRSTGEVQRCSQEPVHARHCKLTKGIYSWYMENPLEDSKQVICFDTYCIKILTYLCTEWMIEK